MHFLHHQLGQVGQHMRQLVGLAALPGLHVFQNGFFTQIKAHHLRHIGVNGFVIGHACAQGVGNHHMALPIDRGQAGHTDEGVRLEAQRVHVVVVHPAVNHIHLLGPLGGLHEDMAIAHKHVAALDQLDAHLLGQKRVFKVGAVEATRRVQHHGGLFHPTRRTQGLQEQGGVVFNRSHRIAAKQVREQAHHQNAVAQHVGHT